MTPNSSSCNQTDAESDGDGVWKLSRDEALDRLRRKIVDGLGRSISMLLVSCAYSLDD